MKQQPVFLSAGLIALTVLAAGACATEVWAGSDEKEVPEGRLTPGGVNPESQQGSATSRAHQPL